MMSKMSRLIPVLMTVLLTLIMATGSAQAQDKAQDLGNVIREFNAEFGHIVDGEMTPEGIRKFEQMITPAFEADLPHRMACASLAKTSVMAASLILAARQVPSMAPVAQLAQEQIVAGSLNAWLVDFSLSMLSSLGAAQTEAAANYQCLQEKPWYAMYYDLPLNSAAMDEAENCYVNKICKD